MAYTLFRSDDSAIFRQNLSFLGPQAADIILKPFKTIHFHPNWVLRKISKIRNSSTGKIEKFKKLSTQPFWPYFLYSRMSVPGDASSLLVVPGTKEYDVECKAFHKSYCKVEKPFMKIQIIEHWKREQG